MVPPPVTQATRLVDHLEHVVIKQSVLGRQSEPWFVIRPQVLVVLFVATRRGLGSLQPNHIKDALSSEIQIHEHPCVLVWALSFCGCIIDFQDVISIDSDDNILRMTVRSGGGTHVLCALWLHPNVHVVIVHKFSIVINILSVKKWMTFHLQRVQNVPRDVTAEVLISLLISLGQLLL